MIELITIALLIFMAFVIGVAQGFKGGERSKEIELRVLAHQGRDIAALLEERY